MDYGSCGEVVIGECMLGGRHIVTYAFGVVILILDIYSFLKSDTNDMNVDDE